LVERVQPIQSTNLGLVVDHPGLNSALGKATAKLYLDNGLMTNPIAALGLEKARLEPLVVELQDSWQSAVSKINTTKTNPNGETGSQAVTAEIYMYGREITDTTDVDGRSMLRAVRNMAVLVVRHAELQFPETVRGEPRVKASHEYAVVAMVLEAVYALQHDTPSIFRGILLNASLRKVKAYSKLEQRRGESLEQYQIPRAEDLLEQSEAKGLRIEADLNHEIFKLKLKLQAGNPRHWEDVPIVQFKRYGYESDAEFKMRSLEDDNRKLKNNDDDQAQKIKLLEADADHVGRRLEDTVYKSDRKDGMILGLKEQLHDAEKEHAAHGRARKQEIDQLRMERDRVKGLLTE